jgi:hypothetical protein
MAEVNGKMLALVLILAAISRIWQAFEFSGTIEDKAIPVPTVSSLGGYGTTDKPNLQHAQLSGYVLYGTITLFGNNPYGWRISNTFFGTLSVALISLLAMLLYSHRTASWPGTRFTSTSHAPPT